MPRRFFLRDIFWLAVASALGVGWWLDHHRLSIHPVPVPRKYHVQLTGTPGVKLQMSLITKPTANDAPERREEIVTAPTQIDFNAVACYAWFDTLPNGASGQDGDDIDILLSKEHTPISGVQLTLKTANHNTGGLGDL